MLAEAAAGLNLRLLLALLQLVVLEAAALDWLAQEQLLLELQTLVVEAAALEVVALLVVRVSLFLN
jgi:hypothetical protein